MFRGRSIRLMATLSAALVLGAGLGLWYRAGPREAGPAERADATQRSLTGADSIPPPAPSVPQPADSAPEAAQTATAGAADSAAAGDADQRQLAKITRGMSAAAAGGILVTATPPGSVTGQLRLREGDVIVAVNGETISSPDEFARIYREQGVPRQLTIVRDGREIHRH